MDERDLESLYWSVFAALCVGEFNESAREKGKLPCLPEIFDFLVAANKKPDT